MIEGLNLHEAVADALAELNPWQQLTFTKTATVWTPDARTPTETTSTLTLPAKIQPVDLQEVQKLGFDATSYQYYRVFISANITQIDQLRQLGADQFTTENGDLYTMTAKSDWIQNGWREGYAYLTEAATGTGANENEPI